MKRTISGLCLAALLTLPPGLPAEAHGGGFVYVPMYVPQAPPQVPAAVTGAYERFHTVAVISAIGATLTLNNQHFLGTKTGALDIADWRIDDQVNSSLHQYLGARFTFKDVAYDRGALASIPNGAWDDSRVALRKYLVAVPNDGVDAFIVVRPDLEYKMPGMPGLALMKNEDNRPMIWANYEIDVLDAHTLELISKAYSRVQTRAGTPLSFAVMPARDSLKLDDDFALNDAQRAELHTDVSVLLTVSLLETLRALQTGVTLPAVGARAIVPVKPDEDIYKGIKSVAIVSAIADKLELEEVSGMTFDHSEQYLPIPDWRLDQQIESMARTALAKRFTIKDVPIDRAKLADAYFFDAAGKRDPSLPGIAPAADVDAYVVFLKVPLPASDSMYKKCQGVGVWNRSALLGEFTSIYSSYVVAVFDAHTLKLIASYPSTRGPSFSTSIALQPEDNTLWPDKPQAMTPDQAKTIRETLVSQLSDSVPETLLRMWLTGMHIDETEAAPSQAPAQ